MSEFRDMMRRARRDAQQGDWSPEPGTHKAVVVEGDAFISRSGDAYAKTRLELRDTGPDQGNQWDHLMGFGSPQQQAINAGQLSVYGLSDEVIDNLDDIDDLGREMNELVGTEVEVSCSARQNGDGVWTSVTSSQGQTQMAVPADTAGLAAAGDTKPDDYSDIPF